MDHDPNVLIGPIRRSDLVAVLCFGAAGYLFAEARWELLAALALLCGMFSGLSPRLRGHFGIQWGNLRIGGTFDVPAKPVRVQATTRRQPARPQPPVAEPPAARHDED
jgi:hypothetical protein